MSLAVGLGASRNSHQILQVRAGMGEKSALIRDCRWRYHGYRAESILRRKNRKNPAAATRFAAAVTLFHHSCLEDCTQIVHKIPMCISRDGRP